MTRIVMLDGGMGQELLARSSHPPSPLWSAKVLMDEPHIVEEVHRDYVKSGAKILTLNSYSATPERLARDADESLFEPMQERAILIAQKAVENSDVQIGGCLSPLKGSYQPNQAPDFEACLNTYRRVVALQKDAVSVFICETMSSVKEVKAAVQAAAESGVPVICGMSAMDVDGTRLRSGEWVADGANAAKEAGAFAVAINCSWPEAITQALPALKASGLAFGGWANAFTKADDLQLGGTVDVLSARTDLNPSQYADHVMQWVDAGATIVGGCCEVGPAHIAELAKRLSAAGHTISGDL